MQTSPSCTIDSLVLSLNKLFTRRHHQRLTFHPNLTSDVPTVEQPNPNRAVTLHILHIHNHLLQPHANAQPTTPRLRLYVPRVTTTRSIRQAKYPPDLCRSVPIFRPYVPELLPSHQYKRTSRERPLHPHVLQIEARHCQLTRAKEPRHASSPTSPSGVKRGPSRPSI